MKTISIIDRIKKLRRPKAKEDKADIPKDLLKKCDKCQEVILTDILLENIYTCSSCNHHFPLRPEIRLDLLLDKYRKIEDRFKFENPIDFEGYEEKHRETQDKTGAEEAIVLVRGEIKDVELVVAVMDNRFMMGSMGSYLGEQITKAFEYAGRRKLPLLIYSTSGGARMQEGIFSLMQMAKTAQAARQFGETGNLYISCMTHPTTGGVSASFASLGDINIAEPHALIGFAGPRVIKETIQGDLPEGFQSSEFLEEKGFLDSIIDRKDMRDYIYRVLKLHGYGSGKID